MELNKALEWAKGIEAHTDGTAYEVDVKNVTSRTDISDVDPQDIKDVRDTETEPNTDGGDEVKVSTDHDLVSAEDFEVTTSTTEGAAKTIDATHVDPVTDSPKRYTISGFDASKNPAFEPGDKANELVIILQNGTLPENGVNGVTAEDLLKVCEEVFICYQESKFACEENQEALNHIQGALGAMARRKNRRTEQGTEGTHEGN